MYHVLLSNDDGVFAPGLRALADAFLAAGWAVSVAAPDQERSAASHSITISRPLVATEIAWEGVPSGTPLSVWKVDGTPADCVKIALHGFFEKKPDIVVSGINNGWNIGTDVHYSGTVGAAMEAAFEGIPAIAVSAKRPDAERYQAAAKYAVDMAERLLKRPLPMPSILNLNIPGRKPCDFLGVVEAPLTCIRYTDAYDCMPYSKNRSAYWLRGDIVEEGCLPGGDLDMLLKGYATYTVLGWDISVRNAFSYELQE